MKILLFYTYSQGYLSSFFYELSLKLTQEGHKVVNFSWKQIQSEEVIDGVKVIVKKKEGYFTNYKYVYNIIKEEKPDVIISNFSYVNPALLFGKLFGAKKNMVWFHSLHEQMESTRLNVFVKKCFLKLADVVIANSYLTKKELNAYYNVSEHKIQPIPFWSAISEKKMEPSDLFSQSDKAVLKIGCPGRLVAHKNQKILIEAAYALKKDESKPFHIYLAGKGEQTELKKQVKELGLINEVSFLNNLRSNDMLQFYKTVDVIVLPSLHEAFGLVFIEAIALGTPVIVSKKFGALSFLQIDEKEFSKFTFNPESSEELADKIREYINHQGLSRDYFKALYNQNFDKEVIFKTFNKIIATT
ncbi:glycosyltransferase family 4 protein [Winogradskyella ouciana]|uniref:glycosyltransferase family 4 protein n=1 Tax=Winogradskyella ouciana TaxID=2608631 RepID=UPI003D28573D